MAVSVSGVSPAEVGSTAAARVGVGAAVGDGVFAGVESVAVEVGDAGVTLVQPVIAMASVIIQNIFM